MARILPTFSIAPRWLCAFGLAVIWTAPVRAQYDPDWARNFRVGVMAGFNIKADFRTTGAFNLSGADIGPTGQSGQNHNYDDGYVRRDDSGNAQGYTTYWGYDNASQYDAASHTLTMHHASSYTVESRANREADAPQIGFDMAYGGVIRRWQRVRLGWEFGFGLLPISITDDSPMGATIDQTTHSFVVPTGVIPPTAPYHGGSSGVGQPSIFDVATLVNNASTNGVVTGSRTLDVTLYAFRLGPTFFWDAHRSFGLTLGAGPAVGLVSGTYRFNETAVTGGSAKNKGSFDSSDILFGGYVNAMVTYHAVKNGDLYLGAQYMPLGTTTFSKGGRSAKLDLSGAVYLSAGLNWPF